MLNDKASPPSNVSLTDDNTVLKPPSSMTGAKKYFTTKFSFILADFIGAIKAVGPSFTDFYVAGALIHNSGSNSINKPISTILLVSYAVILMPSGTSWLSVKIDTVQGTVYSSTLNSLLKILLIKLTYFMAFL